MAEAISNHAFTGLNPDALRRPVNETTVTELTPVLSPSELDVNAMFRGQTAERETFNEVAVVMPADALDNKEGTLTPEILSPEQAEHLSKTFSQHLGNSVGTFGRELNEPGGRVKHWGAFGVAALTQAGDRGRVMVFVLPEAFNRVLTHAMENDWNGYQMAGAEGVAVGGIFLAWAYGVGWTLKKAISVFPKTAKAIEENHPAMVSAVSRGVGGFESKEELEEKYPDKPEEGYDVGAYDSRETIAGKIALAPTRGFKTGLLYGTTAQVGLAKVNQHSPKSAERRLKISSVEAAAALGSIAVGLSSLITNSSPELADHIKNIVTNKNILLGASIGFIGWGAVGNKLARKGGMTSAEKAAYKDMTKQEKKAYRETVKEQKAAINELRQHTRLEARANYEHRRANYLDMTKEERRAIESERRTIDTSERGDYQTMKLLKAEEEV